MAVPKEKVDVAVEMLLQKGHRVQKEVSDGRTWFQIDNRMRATHEEMEALADGVYSLAELEALFHRRRIEETNPNELAEGVIQKWSVYSEVGRAQELSDEFKALTEKALELHSATQTLNTERRNLDLMKRFTSDPTVYAMVERAADRRQSAVENFLDAYRACWKTKLEPTAQSGA